MEIYIGIGFAILCLTVLVSIIGIFKYQFSLGKDKINISPTKTDIDNKPNNSSLSKA